MLAWLLAYIVQAGDAGQGPAASTVENELLRLTVRVEPSAPRLSDTLRLSLETLADPALELDPVPFGPVWCGFTVLGVERELPQLRDGRLLQRTTVELAPTAAGPFLLESIAVHYRAAPGAPQQSLSSAPIALRIASGLAEPDAGLEGLRPPLPPQPLPDEPLSWAYGIPVLLLLAALAWWWRWRARPEPAAPPALSARERARRALEALLAADADAAGDCKAFYIELSAIVRRYVEDSTGVAAPEQTTEEFLRAIRGHASFSEADRATLGAFLAAADLVKFGAQQPPAAAAAEGARTARGFVDTFPKGAAA